MKSLFLLLLVLTLSACSPSSPQDPLARQALENIRTGQLDAVTAVANPSLLQTPDFVDHLLTLCSQFPGYPPEHVDLVDVQETTMPSGERSVQLSYDYLYANETLQAQVTVVSNGDQTRLQSMTLGSLVAANGVGHFFRHWGFLPWILLVVIAGGIGGTWAWKNKQRKRKDQERRDRHERRRRRRERRKHATLSSTPE